MRIVPRELRVVSAHRRARYRRRRVPRRFPRPARQPLHGVHELEHRERAEIGPRPRRHHGGPVPFHHRERVHQGHPCVQPLKPGKPHRRAGRHLQKRCGAAGARAVSGLRGHARSVSRPYGRHRRRAPDQAQGFTLLLVWIGSVKRVQETIVLLIALIT